MRLFRAFLSFASLLEAAIHALLCRRFRAASTLYGRAVTITNPARNQQKTLSQTAAATIAFQCCHPWTTLQLTSHLPVVTFAACQHRPHTLNPSFSNFAAVTPSLAARSFLHHLLLFFFVVLALRCHRLHTSLLSLAQHISVAHALFSRRLLTLRPMHSHLADFNPTFPAAPPALPAHRCLLCSPQLSLPNIPTFVFAGSCGRLRTSLCSFSWATLVAHVYFFRFLYFSLPFFLHFTLGLTPLHCSSQSSSIHALVPFGNDARLQLSRKLSRCEGRSLYGSCSNIFTPRAYGDNASGKNFGSEHQPL